MHSSVTIFLGISALAVGYNATPPGNTAVRLTIAAQAEEVTPGAGFVDYIVSHDFEGDWRYTGRSSNRTGKFFLSPRRQGNEVIASFRQIHSDGSTSADEPVAKIVAADQRIRFLTPGGYADLSLDDNGVLIGTKQSGSATVTLWLSPIKKAR